MSNIGPNFRPPWQQSQSNNQRQPEAASATETAGLSAHQPGNNASANLGGMVAQAGLVGLLAAGMNHELTLASDQLLLLLRNLLQMPKELAQLMALLAEADPTAAQAMLQLLMTSETPVPLAQLQQLLLSHADAAQDKLLKLLQTTAMSPGGQSSQMGELLGTLGELVSRAKESPGQALHSTISLYLPYYPLHPPQAFSLRYEKPSGQQGEEDGGQQGQSSEQLALFIDTLTLGQFKINLASQHPAPLEAVVMHEAAAAPFLQEIAQQTALALGGEGRITLVFILKSGPQKPQMEVGSDDVEDSSAVEPESKQSVALHPAGGISMAALYGAYALIRVIFELDEQNKLHQARAAQL